MLPDTIKDIRRKNYLNQTAFAKRIGVTQGAVSQWECGLTRPNMDQLKAISLEFGISIDDLLAGESSSTVTSSAPITPEARIVSAGMDTLPKEQREQILNVLRAMFSNNPNIFKERKDDPNADSP